MKKENRNYYKEIDEALKTYEEFKPWHTKDIDWICNRIDWCWKFHHITNEQRADFSERACKILDRR